MTRRHILLFFATILLSLATAGGLRLQSPSPVSTTFDPLELSCWFKPCPIGGSPSHFWHRHGPAILTPDVSAFATTKDSSILVIDVNNRATMYDATLQPIFDVALPARIDITAVELMGDALLDDSRILTGHPDGAVLLWDYAGTLHLRAFPGSGSPVSDIAVTDNRRIVTLHRDGSAYISNTAGQNFLPLPNVPDFSSHERTAEAITSDGILLTGHSNGMVKVWGMDPSNPNSVEPFHPPVAQGRAVSSIAEVGRGQIAIKYDNDLAWLHHSLFNLLRKETATDRALLTAPTVASVPELYTAGGVILTLNDGWLARRQKRGETVNTRWFLNSDETPRAVVVYDNGIAIVLTDRNELVALGALTSALWVWIALAASVVAWIMCVVTAYQLILWRWNKDPPPNGFNSSLEADRTLNSIDDLMQTTEDVAETIATFFTHERASASQVVCIDGPWGVGKSTLLGLVMRRLNGSCICIFFNAWHHAKQRHIFAALMDEVRQSWRSSSHMYSQLLVDERDSLKGDIQQYVALLKFYLHLWGIRFRRIPVSFVLFLTLLTSAFTLTVLLFLLSLDSLLQWDLGFKPLLSLVWTSAASSTTGPYLLLLALLSGSFAFFVYLWTSPWNVLRAFPTAPSSLLDAPIGGVKSARSQSAGLSFRYRFQRTFAEVCDALRSSGRNVVIVIDDLDRCSGEMIFEMLEAVNFLTSSGQCFAMLAMDTDQVKTALAASNSDGAADKRDLETAEAYLSKVVTMTVKVPVVDARALLELRKTVGVPKGDEL